MNIAFDSVALFGAGSRNRGIGNYALGQIKSVVKNDPKNQYYFINFFDDFCLNEIIPEKNFIEINIFPGKDQFLFSNKKYKDIFGAIIKNIIKKYKIDIYYITSPFDATIITYEKEWFENVRTVATVYDIIPYLFQKNYLPSKGAKDFYMERVSMLRWIDKCFVISESVKIDLIKHLDFDSKKIEVIYAAIDDRYKKRIYPKIDIEMLLKKFNINNKYIMNTGGDDYRKNIDSLIKAYSKLSTSLKEEYQLVIVCKLSEVSFNKYTTLVEELNVTGRVILTNFVTDDQLMMLYNLASLMVFPSIYEGFGLPVIEAMACGVPVVTSKNSSLGELAEGYAVLVDPFDVDDINEGLKTALTKTDLNVLIDKGLLRAAEFRWQKICFLTIKYLNEILLTSSSSIEKPLNIAIFSPINPIKSGISNYSSTLIKYLSGFFNVDIYIDDYKAKENFNANVKILSHRDFKVNRFKYIQVFYQMGNSSYHTYMLEYIKNYEGILVLHDYNLHDLVINLMDNHILSYKESLYEDYDKFIVDSYLENISNKVIPYKINEIELNGFVTNYVKKVIVHSDFAKEKILRKNFNLIVRKSNLFSNLKNSKLSKSNNISSNINFLVYGHIHETKRILQILDAFTKLLNTSKNSNLKIILLGEVSEGLKERLQEKITHNKLNKHVIITGYISDNKVVEYLNNTSIGLNLRYPHKGESSASLTDMLSFGIPTIISDIGTFKEFPNDVCLKIRSAENLLIEEEIEEIYVSMLKLVFDKDLRDKLSSNAISYYNKNLTIKRAAEVYIESLRKIESSLNESDIKIIFENEILNKNYSENELKKLSQTLSFAKSWL
jgi:glycosyltransferase involved in cell wall biosynthesis